MQTYLLINVYQITGHNFRKRQWRACRMFHHCGVAWHDQSLCVSFFYALFSILHPTSIQSDTEMAKVLCIDGWCSFSKVCLGHFRCISPTSSGLYVFNLTSRLVKVSLEDGWELFYLCWQVENGKHCGRGLRWWRRCACKGVGYNRVYESSLIRKKEKRSRFCRHHPDC